MAGSAPKQEVSVKVLYLLALILVGFATSACNTTRGFGQDVEATGDTIEDTADDAMDDDNE
jgi:predicted small secreted protein